MITLQAMWRQGADFLHRAGIESAVLDAEVLLRYILGLSREEFYRDLTVLWPQEIQPDWEKILNRRAQGTPVAYLIGEKEFFGLSLKVTSAVLVPRPETEILVERVLELFQKKVLPPNARILDIGTGSGAIAIALAKNLPLVQITATDISVQALQVARKNAIYHKVQQRIQFCVGDLWPWPKYDQKPRFDLAGFHLIVSNPPYIPSKEMEQLAPEVHHEPILALDGGPDGLAIYRRLASGLKEYLLPDGWVLLEVGADQADSVSRLLTSVGLSVLPPVLDLASCPRVVQAVYR